MLFCPNISLDTSDIFCEVVVLIFHATMANAIKATRKGVSLMCKAAAAATTATRLKVPLFKNKLLLNWLH